MDGEDSVVAQRSSAPSEIIGKEYRGSRVTQIDCASIAEAQPPLRLDLDHVIHAARGMDRAVLGTA